MDYSKTETRNCAVLHPCAVKPRSYFDVSENRPVKSVTSMAMRYKSSQK